jgi:xylulokinase
MAYLLGLDIGTTGTKALLVTEKGKLIARGTSEYPLLTPKPSWAEQDPGWWWRATKKSIAHVLRVSNVRSREIVGIGLSGQMHGSVFLDGGSKVIRPAILWCDQRTQAECDEITAAFGFKGLLRLTCNPARTGFTAPKILWLRKHEPRHWQRVRKILLPKDYIRFLLTGEFATEVSDASGTLLFDVKNRTWSQALLEKLRIPRDYLPESNESFEISGRVTRRAAEETGLAAGTPIVGGGGDQAAGGVGNGIVEKGIISSVIGTSGVVFAFSDRPEYDRDGRLHTFCHAVPGKWHMMGVTLAAGGSFRWLRDNLCQEEVIAARRTRVDPYELMTLKAEAVPAGSEGVIFLPYMIGERTPYPDPNARGVFLGLTLRHTKAHIVRSVMEGVAFSLRDSLEIMKSLHLPIKEIRASGGGGKSKLWRQIQADVFNTEVVTINIDEGPAFGAALLAAVGAGEFRSVEEACRATIRVTSRVAPQQKGVRRYEEHYALYSSLYPLLRDTFRQLARLS